MFSGFPKSTQTREVEYPETLKWQGVYDIKEETCTDSAKTWTLYSPPFANIELTQYKQSVDLTTI